MSGPGIRGARALRARRAAAQLLSGSEASGLEEVVTRLLAVQAQDFRAARLALRPRGAGSSAAAADRALTEERSLVVAWLNRGTLHLVTSEDYAWLLPLTAPTRLTESNRRLAQEGLSPAAADRAAGLVERALGDEGPLTRRELAERLARRGVPTSGQAMPHLLRLASFRGVAVLGPVREGRQAFVHPRDWLGTAPNVRLDGDERVRALGELAHRYLAGHGPARAEDLAAWAGLPLRDARQGLSTAASALDELEDGLVDLRGRRTPRRLPRPRLLPAFDAYLLGWKDRSFTLPSEHARRIHPGGGVLRPAILVEGGVAGTWTVRRRAGRIDVTLDPFAPLAPEAETALEADAADVARFETA